MTARSEHGGSLSKADCGRYWPLGSHLWIGPPGGRTISNGGSKGRGAAFAE